MATWYEELTHLKRHWYWERLKVKGEGVDRGWDGCLAFPTQWTWVWINSGSWWWTGRPGVLQSMGSQRVGHHDWATELNWRFSGPKYLFLILCYCLNILNCSHNSLWGFDHKCDHWLIWLFYYLIVSSYIFGSQSKLLIEFSWRQILPCYIPSLSNLNICWESNKI